MNRRQLCLDGCSDGANRSARIRRNAISLVAFATLATNLLLPGGGLALRFCRILNQNMARRLTDEDVENSIRRDFVDLIRELAAKAPAGTDLAVVANNEEHPDSVERVVHLAAAFERLPSRTVIASPFNAVAFDAIIAPALVGEDDTHDFPSYGFSKAAATASFTLWVRGNPALDERDGTLPRIAIRRNFRSQSGLVVLLALFLCGVLVYGWTGGLLVVLLASYAFFSMLVAGMPPSRLVAALSLLAGIVPLIVFALLGLVRTRVSAEKEPSLFAKKGVATFLWGIFVFLSLVLTLDHAYSAPNGLGVVGGRAMLWFSSNDIASSFSGGHAFDTFQPAYPPGLALLTLLSHSLSGMGNDWQMQILGLAPFWILLWFLLIRTESTRRRLLVLALFLSSSCLDMACNFYPEGWEILFIVVGLDLLLDGHRSAAWFFIAAAGWFKAEGLIFSFALFSAVRLTFGPEKAPFRAFAASCLFPLLWWGFAIAHGTGVFEYAAPWEPRLSAFPVIARALLTEILMRPCKTAFLLPLLLIGMLFPDMAFWKCRKRGLLAARFTIFALAALFWIFTLSRADLNWHLWSALPRLLWCVSTIAFFVLEGRKTAERDKCPGDLGSVRR